MVESRLRSPPKLTSPRCLRSLLPVVLKMIRRLWPHFQMFA
ncbi:hypothetical protein RISK_005856 [Rhodopirellula islandica]|uniref:Uncharacterized protein n=1 Tax=Rhodopirellula islandica TaxID=595434 RepID=A0A0J1B5C9_RHOIS|nr:hypothetical protein RISK_005856 [Rhodopirellula islandica]